jgi:signal recognition particle subunit SRP54
MFESLTSKLEATFKSLRNKGSLTEADVDKTLEEIRLALLDADVNYNVTKDFCAKVKEKALGTKILKSLNPGQMVIKHVHDSLVEAMGKQEDINLRFAPPVIVMLVGLQGSGKTTSSAKLAKYLREESKRRPLLVPADVYRPAAIEQLKLLGKQLNIEVFPSTTDQTPIQIAISGIEYAKRAAFDTVILDTAGRLQIDQQMMNELVQIVQTIEPHEILLVADAMTGQEAVNVAKGFNDQLEIDGLVLTKLDGDARGGAALSMRAITGKPIKFIGIGEKTDALEVFHPDRMASRILGMGDVLTLIEKANKQVDLEESKELHKKFKKNEFTLEDFHAQLQNIKKMGSISSLAKMIPGAGKMVQGIDEEVADKSMKHLEAMILSMTKAERRDVDLLNGSRKKRIAAGSGTTVEEINAMIQQFSMMKKMMHTFAKSGPSALGNMMRGMNQKHQGFGR